MGVGPGERVAIVSPNSARFLVSFFGVSGYGRVLVPINFRLNAEEVGYIVDHSGATVLLVDPELDGQLAGVDGQAPHRPRRRAGRRAVRPGAAGAAPAARGSPTRTPPASINYTSGTTARPKGVQLTHRNCWLNAVVVRLAHRR